MKSFENKVAAITGAASGMGRALAISLARRGCHLALSDVDADELAQTASLAGSAGRVAITTKRVDVSKRDQVYAWADETAREHSHLNLIFNNAGIAYASTIEGADYDKFEQIVGINFWGVVYGTKAFLPHLKASGDGHVVNISSIFGLVSCPGQGTYNATKFAVRGFTESLREELEMTHAPVSATCVHPGGIKTNIARTARLSVSLKDLGVRDVEESGKQFEKAFRMTAEDAAEVILRGVERNARRVLVGKDARMLDALQRLLPGSYQWIVERSAGRLLG